MPAAILLWLGGSWMWADFWHAEWFRGIGFVTFHIGLFMIIIIILVAVINYRRENNRHNYDFTRYDNTDFTRRNSDYSRRDPTSRKFRRIG